jgi:hypothetical protein
MLAVDAAELGLLTGSIYVRDNTTADLMMAPSAIGYMGAPIAFHIMHGNRRGAILSVVTRLAVPVVGGFLGGELLSCPDRGDVLIDLCPLGNVFEGGMVGMGVAALIDDLGLAYTPGAPAEVVPARSGFSVGAAPRAEGGFTLSLGGSF